MKKICVILVVILLTCQVNVFASANDEYYCGLDWSNIEDLEQYIIDEPTPYVSLPTFVDNSNMFPQPGAQGNIGSCVSWAVAYALHSAQEYSKRQWALDSAAHLFSPAFSHARLTLMYGGRTIENAMSVIVNYGACPLTYCEYDGNSISAPTSRQYAAAKLYKTSSFNVLASLTAIKNRIANGDGVVVGINVYSELYSLNESNPVFDTISGNIIDSHAICLIGYDDSIGAFKFINSWGTEWGIDGYGWISYELLQNTAVNHYGACYGFVMNKKTIDDYIMGDINNDGMVNAADARLALRFSADVQEPTDDEFVLADVDGNADITAADARYITQYSSGVITKLPLYE